MSNEWWKKEIAYQIYPKSFKDSNGDGIGDLRGIIEKLDYLEDLGVTLLWLCPIYKSPMDDNGYDISDYYDINPEFGTMSDLEELIEKLKIKELKLLWISLSIIVQMNILVSEALKIQIVLIMIIISLNPLKMVKNQITGDLFLEVQYGKR